MPSLREFVDKPSIDEISSVVGSVFGNNIKEARNVAIYICHKYTGRKLRDIGDHFKISESAVSLSSKRMIQKMEDDPVLKKKVTKSVKKLNFLSI